MSLYNAAQAMVDANEYATKLIEQIEKGLTYHNKLRSSTGVMLRETTGALREEVLAIDTGATEIVDAIRDLQTKALVVRGQIKRLGEPPEQGAS